MIDFFPESHIKVLSERRFGICDPGEHQPAYAAKDNGENWIAAVDNFYQEYISFIPVDHCIEFDDNGKRCDCFLFHGQSIIFIELKDRKGRHSHEWLKGADEQLRSTIARFETECERSKDFVDKRAYVANRQKPHFQSGQMNRIQSFRKETGYVLRISKEIKIHE